MGDRVRIVVIVAAAIILRWCVTYHSYSGQEKPPMYGDYEAQRHWQEITLNLPIDRWYTNSSDNDLQYWGLDYPPLTAYHSFLLGKIAKILNPKFVELYSSRGYESEEHKYFMRLSVLVADIILYLPAVLYYVYKAGKSESAEGETESSNILGLKSRDIVLTTALFYPGIILIDYGHFQYNCISLGLFIGAVAAILQNSMIAASFLFVLALNYKQMELYHALPFFFYILSNNTPYKRKSLLSCLRGLICVSLTVLLTFIIIWAPFIQKWSIFTDVLTRLFPFARGVFEDKVANVWCAVNVVFKLRETFTNLALARLCLLMTTLVITPSCLDLYFCPLKEKFILSLINTALGFYLFSFQVHEKSILLVAVPVILYFHKCPLTCFWFLLISSFSMLPLFIKDGLFLAYFSLNLLYGISVYLMWPQIFTAPRIRESLIKNKPRRPKDSSAPPRKSRAKQPSKSNSLKSKLDLFGNISSNAEAIAKKYALLLFRAKMWAFCGSITGAVILSVASIVLRPPEKYPDLFPLLVSVYSCGHFILFFLFFNCTQIEIRHSTKAKFY